MQTGERAHRRAHGPAERAAICARPPADHRQISFAPPPPLLRPTQCTMVRLITHNLLACHAKGCTSNNFPLQLKDVQVELREAEFNPDFLRGFIPRLEWGALVDAARQVRCACRRLGDVDAERGSDSLLAGRYVAASRASGDDGR